MTQILIVESHPEVRRLLERMVRRLGHEPVIATAPAMPLLKDIELVIVELSDPTSALLAEQVQPLATPGVAAPAEGDLAA